MSKANLLDRREVVSTLLADRKDALVVAGLGASTYDLAAAGDNPRNLYLWGAMGGAVMMGLGLALAQPDTPVVVVTGDGEMLMGMGSLATVGVQKPKNLSILVLDNEAYGETGGQASHTSASADLVGVARACGIPDAKAISTLGEIESFAKAMQDPSSGPRFANVKIDAANLERVLSNRDGTFIMNRLRGALGHAPI
ncbi:MAG TPA: thiamine pyrophosphate-dependent enzyme [Bradyrhizobium sp.]|jgi:thiamine pyrophosphate-dependent acetolactate synthase large subunit-like protein|nr:thiamine pyrophosphate-dependent enzyme [Bradyrhizobium sp.]